MESNGATTEAATAAAQLEALRADRAAMADRAMQPWWYDVTLGLLVFGLFAQYSLDSDWLSIVASLAFVAGLSALMSWYRRRNGFWIGGLRSGRTRRAIWVWVSLYVLVLLAAVWLENVHGVRGAMVIAGAVLGVGITATSRWWTRLFIAELRAGR